MTPPPTQPELMDPLPCPFCGIELNDDCLRFDSRNVSMGEEVSQVLCMFCDSLGPPFTATTRKEAEKGALKRWNNRSPITRPDPSPLDVVGVMEGLPKYFTGNESMERDDKGGNWCRLSDVRSALESVYHKPQQGE